jgi:hypothetical protein
MLPLTRLLPLLALLIAGCAIAEGLHVGASSQKQRNARPVFGRPIPLPVGNMLMIPFALETEERKFGGFEFGSFSVSGSSAWGSGSSVNYYGSSSLTWNNVAFYLPATGETRLLLDQPAVICRFHAPSDKGPVHGDYLLFAIATHDTNHDGLINDDDAIQLLRTDLKGEHLIPITPPDMQLLDIDSAQWLYLRVRHDSDGDGKFTDRDRIDLLRVDPREWSPAEHVISPRLRQRAFDAATSRPATSALPAR